MNYAEQYDEDYFLRGCETGKSLYKNYTWLPDSTIPMVQRMINYCGIGKNDSVLDFGCARGYSVKAFRQLGYNAYGVDVSRWAIDNADEETKPFLRCLTPEELVLDRGFDWIIAKDVLEHVPYAALTVSILADYALKGVFAIVPLSNFDNTPYVIPDYERDVTHLQRYKLLTWVNCFLRVGWRVDASYCVPGIKDNWYKPGWEKGNGFILARRVEG